MTRHDIGRRVADQYHIDARLVYDARHREVICREHGDLGSLLLKLMQCMRRDALDLFIDRHAGMIEV